MNAKSNYLKKALILIVLFACVWAQSVYANTQGISFNKESIRERVTHIAELGRKTGQELTYESSLPANEYVPSFTAKTNNMEEWLYRSLENTRYTYRKISDKHYTVVARPTTPKTEAPAPAQTAPGTLRGKVLDETGDILPGATIKVVGGTQGLTGKGTATDLDGGFALQLPSGTYTGFIGYQTQRVTDVRVESGKNTPLDITLAQASTELGEVVVTATYNQASAEGLYARQQTMAAMSDGISSSMIKRTSDNNIAQSLKRISGITISGGKHVTVRGMSDRYNNVTLNGSSLPSTEANQRNFSFDIIPTGLVDNILISKTFSPDLPGEFTGGLVEIKTLAVPDKPFLDVSLGTGGKTLSTGKPFRHNKRFAGDWFLGDIKSRKWFAGRGNEEQSMQNAIQKNNYDMLISKGKPTQSHSITFGKPFTFGRHSLGVVGAVTYRHEENTKETLEGTFLNEQAYYKPFGMEDLRSTDHTAVTNLGAVLNVGWQQPGHKVTLRNLFNNRFSHNGQLRFVDAGYFYDQVTYYHRPVINTLYQTQLEGAISCSVRKSTSRGWRPTTT